MLIQAVELVLSVAKLIWLQWQGADYNKVRPYTYKP